MSDQMSYDEFSFGHDASNDFALNPEPRCPCMLVLDVSYSMSGRPLDELNAGLQTFKRAMGDDPLALKRVEVGLVTFGPVNAVQQFVSAATFEPPRLEPAGDTPLGGALNVALDMVESRKQEYRDNGVKYYRPWVFLITDGAPTDDWRHAATRIKQAEKEKSLAFFPIGVQGADMNVLGQLGEREPLILQGLQFREMFLWLSSSLSAVSQSIPGEKVALEPPRGWASV